MTTDHTLPGLEGLSITATLVPSRSCVFTTHAWLRMGQMGLSSDDVLDTVNDYELAYPDHDGEGLGAKRCFVRGQVVAVLNDNHNVVITVLWHSENRYERPDAPLEILPLSQTAAVVDLAVDGALAA